MRIKFSIIFFWTTKKNFFFWIKQVGGLDKKERPIKRTEEEIEEAKVKGKKLKMTETQFSVKNIEKFKEVAANLKVMARSTPEDKFLLVTGLKQIH